MKIGPINSAPGSITVEPSHQCGGNSSRLGQSGSWMTSPGRGSRLSTSSMQAVLGAISARGAHRDPIAGSSVPHRVAATPTQNLNQL